MPNRPLEYSNFALVGTLRFSSDYLLFGGVINWEWADSESEKGADFDSSDRITVQPEYNRHTADIEVKGNNAFHEG